MTDPPLARLEARQLLCGSPSRRLDDGRTLTDYGIGPGAVLYATRH